MAFAVNRQCTAKAKRTGERCKSPAVNGYDVCRLHGGKTPRGIASVNTKHGRYSKHLPTRLLDKYEEAIADPELGTLKSEIALIDSRIGEILENLDIENFGNVWGVLSKCVNDLHYAMISKDGKAMANHMLELKTITESGIDDISNWDTIVGLIEQRRKLVDSERRRLVDLQQMITTERAMLMITALTGIIRQHVTDGKQLAAISADIGNLIATRTSITTE